MTPTLRAAAALVLVAAAALVVPVGVAVAAAAAVLGATLADALAVRRVPRTVRAVPATLARGVGVPLRVDVRARDVRVRQPLVADLALDVREGSGSLAGTLVGVRRGRHLLPAVALRTRGPLGLGAWTHGAVGEAQEVTVFPDLPTARRLARAVREGRFREAGLRAQGHIGLGTAFERIRGYQPDDDIRQVNWRATARVGRPMSNQHRLETDQEMVLAIDAGRLMAAPVGDRTRLDAALDAVAALALVADELGDRCGAVAFDDAIRRRVRPTRAGGTAVIRATFDLEPSEQDADYGLALRTVGGGKRAFVVVATDLLDEAAAQALVAAVPVLARRHEVLVASVRDPDLDALVQRAAASERDALLAAAALDLLEARRRATALVRRTGAQVVAAPPDRFAAACVQAYLQAKRRRRL